MFLYTKQGFFNSWDKKFSEELLQKKNKKIGGVFIITFYRLWYSPLKYLEIFSEYQEMKNIQK